MNLQLRKFKPETITDDRVCVFIGKRNTGKSTLVKDIMYHKKHLPAGIVLSGTEEGNHFYSDFVPDLFIYGDYDRDAIERVMARQRKLVGAGKSNCGAFMLLDDCMYDSKFFEGHVYTPVFYERSSLEDFLHAYDAICDGLTTGTTSQCRLCLYFERKHYPEQRKVIQIILWDLSIIRYVL